MQSRAESVSVGFLQVVQLFAPPTNPANAPCAENSLVIFCEKSAAGIRRFCDLPTTENDVLSEKKT